MALVRADSAESCKWLVHAFLGEASLPTFFEFFSGGGMVRAGLGPSWKCLFANDFDQKKVAAYAANWGHREVLQADVRQLMISDLPKETPDLVWASFPCQDLSLAGEGAGLSGDRSGTFWPFWNLVGQMIRSGRKPSIIALENVGGTLTSHGGRDFRAIVQAFLDIGFNVGAMMIDARHFVPQSRPRLFFIGVPTDQAPGFSLMNDDGWHPAALRRSVSGLPRQIQDRWIWWQLPAPAPHNQRLADLLEQRPVDVALHSKAQTKALIDMMGAVHKAKLAQAKASGKSLVGCMYRRTRKEDGRSIQRVEVRFDDIAGCLRTPAGGSSRQLIMIVNGKDVSTRLISARETARLMGLPDDYQLPARYNDAYHLTGDGVVVPVVKYLSDQLFTPHIEAVRTLKGSRRTRSKAQPMKPDSRGLRPTKSRAA